MWSLGIEKGLFNELLEQANNGKRADNGFKKEAWEAACKAVWAITTQPVTIKQCKSKAESQKALWKDLEWLKEQSGFRWEDGRVTAEDKV
jgi:Myb/SANT-like DNA-binding domain